MHRLLPCLLSILLLMTAQVAAEEFAGKDLTRRNFKGRTMNGADFSGANLTDAVFTDAVLRHANFRNSVLSLTGFWNTDLSDADFRGATGNPISFGTYSKLTNANLEGLTFKVSGEVNLHQADLKNATIIASTLINCDLSKSDLRGTNMRQVSLVTGAAGPNFRGALYDDNTSFPVGFDIEASGAVKAR